MIRRLLDNPEWIIDAALFVLCAAVVTAFFMMWGE